MIYEMPILFYNMAENNFQSTNKLDPFKDIRNVIITISFSSENFLHIIVVE
jgi:hypothetical protein